MEWTGSSKFRFQDVTDGVDLIKERKIAIKPSINRESLGNIQRISTARAPLRKSSPCMFGSIGLDSLETSNIMLATRGP